MTLVRPEEEVALRVQTRHVEDSLPSVMREIDLAQRLNLSVQDLREKVAEFGLSYLDLGGHVDPRRAFTEEMVMDLLLVMDENGDDLFNMRGWLGPKPAITKPAKRRKKRHDDFVYFIEAVGANRVKIGKAKDPDSRLKDLQTGSPFPLRVVSIISQNEVTERELHHMFARFRVCGEWFDFHMSIKQYVNELNYDEEAFK